MSLVLAIDPGVRFPGAAVFVYETKQLLGAVYVRAGGFNERFWTVLDVADDIVRWAIGYGNTFGAVAVEWPQVYGGRRSGGNKDPNDLFPLAALNGAVLALMSPYMPGAAPTAVHYRPSVWKGTMKKNPTARRVLGRLEHFEISHVQELEEFKTSLSEAEAKNKECKHPTMNALDAVGLGLHFLGRLGRKRVIAR